MIERQMLAIGRNRGDDKPIGVRELARRTVSRDPENRGVAHQTLAPIVKGSGGVPEPATLARLARGLAVSDSTEEADRLFAELVAAAGRAELGGVSYTPPDAIYELNRYERSLVNDVINGLAAAKRRGRTEQERLRAPGPDSPAPDTE